MPSGLLVGEMMDDLFTSCCGGGATACTGEYVLPTDAPSSAPTASTTAPADVCASPQHFDPDASPGPFPASFTDAPQNTLYVSSPTCAGDYCAAFYTCCNAETCFPFWKGCDDCDTGNFNTET